MNALPQVSVMREIADGAKIAPDAVVGPYCVIGPDAVIGPRTALGPRVTVIGRTTIGADNVIQTGCVLGAFPQDLKYHGAPTYLIIGDGNRLGPNVTAHVGTEDGGYLTRVGNGNVLEAGAHVAHDCFVEDRTHLGAGVLLAGHILVETGAVLEELVGVHHFTSVGCYSRVGARTPVRRDVPPFTFYTSYGYYTQTASVVGAHDQGLDSAALPPAERAALAEAVKRLFDDEQALSVKINEILAAANVPPSVRHLCEFCQRSLGGTFGRHRESLRGQLPSESRAYLPKDVLAAVEKA